MKIHSWTLDEPNDVYTCNGCPCVLTVNNKRAQDASRQARARKQLETAESIAKRLPPLFPPPIAIAGVFALLETMTWFSRPRILRLDYQAYRCSSCGNTDCQPPAPSKLRSV